MRAGQSYLQSALLLAAVCLGAFAFDAQGIIVCEIEPNEGHIAGGTAAFIFAGDGDILPNKSQVYFGDVPATLYPNIDRDFLPPCSTRYPIMIPPHPAGVVDIRIVSPSGEATLHDAFTYLPGPKIVNVWPTSGSTAGNNFVMLGATGMSDVSPPQAFVGDIPVEITYYQPPQLAFWTPPGVAGEASIRLVNEDGGAGTATFRYEPFNVTGLSRYSVLNEISSEILMIGTGFSAKGMRVSFGAVDGTVQNSFWNLLASHELYIETPITDLLGEVEVTVHHPSGESVTLQEGIRFTDQLPLTPQTEIGFGPTKGGSKNCLYGYVNLGPSVNIFFDGIAATDVRIVSTDAGGYLCYTTPPHPAGVVDVTITAEGIEAITLEDAYTYLDSPMNDELATALPIEPNDWVIGDNLAALTEATISADTCSIANQDVFYRLTAVESGVLKATLFSANVYNTIRLYDANLNLLDCAGVYAERTRSGPPPRPATVNLNRCASYYLRVAARKSSLMGGEYALITKFEPETKQDAGTIHSADLDEDYRISLAEVLRILQFYNAGGFHCLPDSEDGYGPGIAETKDCPCHDADNAPLDWRISLEEVLRMIQLYNAGDYTPCTQGEESTDGYCIL